jgi:hypothetical protein
MIQQWICIFMCVHYLQEEQTTWSNSHTAFGCTYTIFTEKKCGVLHLTFCALYVRRREGSKQQSYYMLLSVHCLHWEKQSGNCRYSPFGYLCTVFFEKNSREPAVILHLAICALSSLRKTVRKLQLFSIWLSVHCLPWEELTRSRGYSPFDCLFTVFTEKNRQETAVISHLDIRAVSWRRTFYMKQHSRFILLCVFYRLDKEIFCLVYLRHFGTMHNAQGFNIPKEFHIKRLCFIR